MYPFKLAHSTAMRVAFVAAITAGALLCGGCRCKLIPWALAVDPSLTGNSDADGMLEPGETVVVEPSWAQPRVNPSDKTSFTCNASLGERGTAASLTGPIQGDYVVQDGASSYGTIGIGGTKQCADCYSVFVSAPTGRPARHWDASLTENLTGTFSRTKAWTLHIGESFGDVPRTNPFYTKIETLLHSGITAGCSATGYCPDATLSRAQIAIFLARGIAKGGANVPQTGLVNGVAYSCVDSGTSLFADVAPTDSFCKHAHYLAALNVMTGCSPTSYCPNDTVSRLDMTESVARALVQPGGDDAVPLSGSFANGTYSCDAASPNLHFTDVSVSDSFCKHAHYLWARGIVEGCSATTFCTAGDVTRNAMAKFLVNAFALKLYGT